MYGDSEGSEIRQRVEMKCDRISTKAWTKSTWSSGAGALQCCPIEPKRLDLPWIWAPCRGGKEPWEEGKDLVWALQWGAWGHSHRMTWATAISVPCSLQLANEVSVGRSWAGQCPYNSHCKQLPRPGPHEQMAQSSLIWKMSGDKINKSYNQDRRIFLFYY